MGKYVSRLEKIFNQVAKLSPFSNSEKKTLTKRDQVFVRNLQIKDRSSKEDAIKKLQESKLKGVKVYKRLQKDVTSYLKDLYPVHDKKIPEDEGKISGKKLKPMTAKEFKTRLLRVKPERRKKFITGHKRYPDATFYELDQGINSIKSRQYRIRHGRPSSYEGRIKK